MSEYPIPEASLPAPSGFFPARSINAKSQKVKIALCRRKNLPGDRQFRRDIVATERLDGLIELRGSLFGSAPRGPGTRKTDGRAQPEHARLLLPCRRDGGFKPTDRFIEVRGVEPQQTFRTQPINFRKKDSDAGFPYCPQDRFQRLQRLRSQSSFEPNARKQSGVERRKRPHTRNARKFRFHLLQAAGGIISARAEPSGHKGSDRSLWRQIELVRDFDYSACQS